MLISKSSPKGAENFGQGKLIDLYQQWAMKTGMKCDLLELAKDHAGGVVRGSLQIYRCYGLLKTESGRHLVFENYFPGIEPRCLEHGARVFVTSQAQIEKIEVSLDQVQMDIARIHIDHAPCMGYVLCQRLIHLPTNTEVLCRYHQAIRTAAGKLEKRQSDPPLECRRKAMNLLKAKLYRQRHDAKKPKAIYQYLPWPNVDEFDKIIQFRADKA